MPTKTPAQRVTYSDGKYTDYTNWSTDIDTKEKAFNGIVKYLCSFSTNVVITSSFEAASKAEALEIAESIAVIGGVNYVKLKELYRYKNGSVYQVEISTNSSFKYYYAYNTNDYSYLSENEVKVLEICSQLVEEAQQYETDYEKELFIHDYLVGTIDYQFSNNDQNPYGALVEKNCVCNGYATSFDLLMYMLGIPCTFVSGLGNGGNHAWNQVLIDGAWYNVDVTWDDPYGNASGLVYYVYLNVNDDVFYSNHVPENEDVMDCFATEYEARYREYYSCSTQQEANTYAKKQTAAGEKTVYIFYTGEKALNPSSIRSATGKGVSCSNMTAGDGTVYVLTFH